MLDFLSDFLLGIFPHFLDVLLLRRLPGRLVEEPWSDEFGVSAESLLLERETEEGSDWEDSFKSSKES